MACYLVEGDFIRDRRRPFHSSKSAGGQVGRCPSGKPRLQGQTQRLRGFAWGRLPAPHTPPSSPPSPHTRKEILCKSHLIKDLYSEAIKNSQKSIIRANNSIKIWAKDVNRHFTKEDIWMANKPIGQVRSALSVTGRCQLKPQRHRPHSYPNG